MLLSWVHLSAVALVLLLLANKNSLLRRIYLARYPGPFLSKLSSLWLVHQCRNTRSSEVIVGLHRKYGDFVQIGPNHLSINNPKAIAEIYAHKTGFTKSEFYDAFLQVDPVIFNARDVETHTRKKKFLNPAFSANALLKHEPYMDAEILGWKNRIIGMLQDSCVDLDMVVWTNFLAFDAIGSFAFGKSFGFVDMGADPNNLIATIDTRGEVLNALGALPPAIRPWMKYHPFDTFWSAGLRATANLEKIGREAYNLRKGSDEPRKDMLSYLFQVKDTDTKEPIQESEIIAESISFIVGGSDTTSSTMSNFIDFVSRDQTLQARLQAELDKAFAGQPPAEWVPTEKEAGAVPLLYAILREVMRIRPTSATGLPRITPKGGRNIAGEFIPEMTVVSVPTGGIMSDDRVFSSPEDFNPERWLEPDANKLMNYYLPFSTGPRACIGRNFASMEILKTMALLFKLFEVKRNNTEPTVIKEGFFNKAAECKVTLTQRIF